MTITVKSVSILKNTSDRFHLQKPTKCLSARVLVLVGIMIHLGSWVALVNCSTCTEEKDTPFHIFPSSKIRTLHLCKFFFSLPEVDCSIFTPSVSYFSVIWIWRKKKVYFYDQDRNQNTNDAI